jgi:hypothetical protein
MTRVISSKYSGVSIVVCCCCLQLERKRHIGNDIVNIVFLDGTPEEMAAFSPNCIKSQFTRMTIF